MSTEASFGDLPQQSPLPSRGQEAPSAGGPPGATIAQFEYRGCQFTFCIVPRGPEAYEPHVLYRYGLSGLEQMALPQDTEAYAGVEEAVRHAQQQAVRWVHDRTGDGQGRF